MAKIKIGHHKMHSNTNLYYDWRVQAAVADPGFLKGVPTSKISGITCYYCPQRSCKGYAFTPVCLSTGRGSASVYVGISPGSRNHPPLPPEQTPLPYPLSRHPPESRHPLPLGADTPSHWEQTPSPPPPSPQMATAVDGKVLLECILVLKNICRNG